MDESSKFGRYEILERLGKGGMGVIYKAHDDQLDRVVALKTILPEFVSSPEVKERLIREAQAAARLQHPNVVTIFDIGETDDKRLYFAMEYVRGRSLREIIPLRIPLERRLEIMADVCKALGFAHQHGIIHRDVKPTNVLLAEDGTVKLFDFGIAHLAGSSLTRTGVAIGTPEYMSPEMVEGGELDARSDIFSCGVMLYEMLTRNNPFRSDRITTTMYRIVHSKPSGLRQLRPNLPAVLEEILAKMLAKNPDERYSSMEEVVEDLEHIVSRGLLNKAVRAKELGDLMEQVEAKVAAAESDPRVRQLLEEKLAKPLSSRRSKVRKIAKASDTSITMAHIDRELISLRQFEERLDQFLDKELPHEVEESSGKASPPPPTEDSHPRIDDTAATMRWEGDTTARQGMAAALSAESQAESAGSAQAENAGEPASTAGEKSPEEASPAVAGRTQADAAAESGPPPPPEPPSAAGAAVTGREEPAERPEEESIAGVAAEGEDEEASARPPVSGRQEPVDRPRDYETEPTVVVPSTAASKPKGWLIPASILAGVLLVAVIWIVVAMWPERAQQTAQQAGTDASQEASLEDSQAGGLPDSEAGAEDGDSPQQSGAGSDSGASAGQLQPSGGQAARPAAASQSGGTQAAAPDTGDSSQGSPSAPADESAASASYSFEVHQTNARKSLIPGNRECAGTLEVRAEMIRFRSEECTSRTLVRAILSDVSLEEGILTVRQSNDTSYTFAIAEEDRERLTEALSRFDW
ncbi:MAG TPA: protein kinase [Acidobacteriota bacterium]|nr:protein kinase [Acidobacteriota bacterium]